MDFTWLALALSQPRSHTYLTLHQRKDANGDRGADRHIGKASFNQNQADTNPYGKINY